MLTQKIDDAFKHMERNVDVFLDWYYSLPADYVRIAKLLTGEFENYLDKQLRLTLNRGEPFEGFESYFLSIRDSDPARRSKYKDVLERILSENSITVSDPSDVFVTEKIEDPNAFSLNPESAFEIAHQRFKMRGFLATGAATPSAVVGIKLGVGVAKAVSKTVVAKGVIKVAAKAIAKVVAWSVGVKIGSIIGGAVGSLVPIAGTVAGAAVGGSVGALGLAVGVDKLLLEIEETIDRSEFRATLVEALNQERQKMLNAVRHSTTEGRESQSPSS